MGFDTTKLSKWGWLIIAVATVFNLPALIMFILLLSYHEQCKAKPTESERKE